jgi:tryptophan 2,3-dioxygenase
MVVTHPIRDDPTPTVISQEQRVKYNQAYSRVFGDDPEALAAIQRSESEPALATLVQRWLERTPGLETGGFDFWGKYRDAVGTLLAKQQVTAEVGHYGSKMYSEMDDEMDVMSNFRLPHASI